MIHADLFLLVILLVCLYTDFKYRRIYNAVTLTAMVLGMILNFTVQGPAGLSYSAKGLLLGMALFFLPFAFGGLGAGDVKLLGAIGAVKGPQFVFYAFLCTAIVGGLISVILLIYRRKLFSTLARMGEGLKTLILSHFTVWDFGSLDAQAAESISFPYGLAITLGSFWTYWVM